MAFAALAMVFDGGLGSVLALETLWSIRPSAAAVLAAFIALSAPRYAALWSCLVLGLLLDLSAPLSMPGGRVLHLIGPCALGFTAGGWLVLRGRSMVFRQRALSIGAMTVLLLLAANAVAIALYAARSWYPGGPVHWTDGSAAAAILRRGLVAVYSGLLAVPVGWLLVQSTPLWGFETIMRRSPGVLRKA